MKLNDALEIIIIQSKENGVELDSQQAYAGWKTFCEFHPVTNTARPEIEELKNAFKWGYLPGQVNPSVGSTVEHGVQVQG